MLDAATGRLHVP